METKRQGKTEKAGLVMSVTRLERKLRQGHYGKRVSTTAAVYMAATIEYLSAEVLELAGNAAQQNRKGRISPRHIMLAVKSDAELTELLKDVQIAEAGVMPNIHPNLLPKHSKNIKDNSSTTMSDVMSQEL